MVFKIEYDISEEQINWKVTIFGILFFFWRTLAMNSMKVAPQTVNDQLIANYTSDNSILFDPYQLFMPDVLHVSYFISLCLCLSMVFSFRVKVLNAVPIIVLPSVLITIPMKDIPILLRGPSEVGWLYWANYLTIHIPIVFFAFYIYLCKKELLNRKSTWIATGVGFAWFFGIDNKTNGVLNQTNYIIVSLVAGSIWIFILIKYLLKDSNNESDVFFAPLIIPRRIFWTSKQNKIKEKNNTGNLSIHK